MCSGTEFLFECRALDSVKDRLHGWKSNHNFVTNNSSHTQTMNSLKKNAIPWSIMSGWLQYGLMSEKLCDLSQSNFRGLVINCCRMLPHIFINFQSTF